MSTANTRAQHFRSTVGKIVRVLAFASVIGALSMVPALGQDNHRRQGHQDGNGQQRQGYQERGGEQRRWQSRRWQSRQWQEERGRRVYHQRYGYSAPLYVPPPVVYVPVPPPGIRFFFPFHIP